MDNCNDTDFLIVNNEAPLSQSKKKVRFSETVTIFREEHTIDGKYYPIAPTFISLRSIIESDDNTMRTHIDNKEPCTFSAICAFIVFLVVFFFVFTVFVKKLLIIEIESKTTRNDFVSTR